VALESPRYRYIYWDERAVRRILADFGEEFGQLPAWVPEPGNPSTRDDLAQELIRRLVGITVDWPTGDTARFLRGRGSVTVGASKRNPKFYRVVPGRATSRSYRKQMHENLRSAVSGALVFYAKEKSFAVPRPISVIPLDGAEPFFGTHQDWEWFIEVTQTRYPEELAWTERRTRDRWLEGRLLWARTRLAHSAYS
jgi:hypothetical protein